ncbi:MAG: four-helix bundle copper-binding protein [Magnetococcales bacterium]|nr:four-helix bundle copper-binding protein [Magnetococcales bacterium]
MPAPEINPLNRRQLLTAGTATVLLGTLTQDLLAAGESHDHHQHHAAAPKNQAILTATLDCIATGEACLAHCLSAFRAGDTTLAACASSVSEMLPVSRAMFQLANLDSRHLAKLAAVCIEVCRACEAECRKHADKHATCKAMAESCAACVKACQKLTK